MKNPVIVGSLLFVTSSAYAALDGPLTPEGMARVVGDLMPEGAIVSDEGATSTLGMLPAALAHGRQGGPPEAPHPLQPGRRFLSVPQERGPGAGAGLRGRPEDDRS